MGVSLVIWHTLVVKDSLRKLPFSMFISYGKITWPALGLGNLGLGPTRERPSNVGNKRFVIIVIIIIILRRLSLLFYM